jgi:hypothetical protein
MQSAEAELGGSQKAPSSSEQQPLNVVRDSVLVTSP